MTEESKPNDSLKFCKQKTREKLRNARLKLISEGKFIGKNHPSWKGGRYTDSMGYVKVYVGKEHPKQNKGVIREHILVMEKHLNRYLNDNELVHHIDGNRQNNDISNLQLMTRNEHMKYHHTKDKSNRVCYVCSSRTTYTSKGHSRWYGSDRRGWRCGYCYDHKRFM